MIKKITYIIIAFFLFAGCGTKEIRKVEDYLSFVNSAENGLVIKKQVNGFEIKLTYLSPDYLAYRELSAEENALNNKMDSVKNFYSKTMTFMMTITPKEEKRKGMDPVFYGIRNYAEYKERLYNLNFEIENNISMETGGIGFKPVLTSFENSYGLSAGRSILFVFAPSEAGQKEFYTSENIDFIYDDELFDTGINHFTFIRENLLKIPRMVFAENNTEIYK